jgi:rhodanese-related sulfurtransferase
MRQFFLKLKPRCFRPLNVLSFSIEHLPCIDFFDLTYRNALCILFLYFSAAKLKVPDPHEIAEGHIPEAINIPSNIFAAGSAVLDKEKLIVVYCKSGGRSYTAYRKLHKLDYSKITQAIFADWEAAGLPVEK